MIVSFQEADHRDLCCKAEVAEKKLGRTRAEAIASVIADAEASETAAEFIELFQPQNVDEGDSLLVPIGADYEARFVATGQAFGQTEEGGKPIALPYGSFSFQKLGYLFERVARRHRRHLDRPVMSLLQIVLQSRLHVLVNGQGTTNSREFDPDRYQRSSPRALKGRPRFSERLMRVLGRVMRREVLRSSIVFPRWPSFLEPVRNRTSYKLMRTASRLSCSISKLITPKFRTEHLRSKEIQ